MPVVNVNVNTQKRIIKFLRDCQQLLNMKMNFLKKIIMKKLYKMLRSIINYIINAKQLKMKKAIRIL